VPYFAMGFFAKYLARILEPNRDPSLELQPSLLALDEKKKNQQVFFLLSPRAMPGTSASLSIYVHMNFYFQPETKENYIFLDCETC
jgi:hypothetical protein